MNSQNNAIEPNAENEKNKVNENSHKMEKVEQAVSEDERAPSKKMYAQIKVFRKLLNLCDEIPQDIKEELYKNVMKNAKELEYKIDNIENTAARYLFNLREVWLSKLPLDEVIARDARHKSILHEIMHAATTERDEEGKAIRLGFQKKDGNKWLGIGLNESATEYYAQKLYSKTGHKKVYTSYEAGVYIIKNLIELYGETTMLDAMINGTEKLEQLIAKDGKSYLQIRDLMDEYCNRLYGNLCDDENKAENLYEIEEPIRDIQFILAEIRFNRNLNKESVKNKVFSWFKGAKSKIKNIFNKKEEPLLLNPGVTAVNQILNKNAQNFFETVKVDESRQNNYNKNHQEQYYTKTEQKRNQNKEEER